MKKTKLIFTLSLIGYIANAQVLPPAGNYLNIYGIAGIGTGGYTGDGGLALSAEIKNPQGIVLDAAGNIYFSDQNNQRIRKVTPTNVISTFAGNGTGGYSGDGSQATAAELNTPAGLAIDASGNIYIADGANNRVRKVTTAGIISTVAGYTTTGGYSGDGGQATAAKLYDPQGLAFDASGNLYIADPLNARIRKVTTAGIISTFAGNGTQSYSGDGGQATAAELQDPNSVALDASGNLYIADYGNARIRIVNTSGIINTFAGNGTAGFSGDNGQATAAKLYEPTDVKADASGNVYIADYFNNRVRKVSSGIITTYAGGGSMGSFGAPATSAVLNSPTYMALDASANLYIADAGAHYVAYVSVTCLAIAGPNGTDQENDCGGWPGVTIGTPSQPNMTYSWTCSSTCDLSSTSTAQPTSTYTTSGSPATITYTLTVNNPTYSCAQATSTVQVTAITCGVGCGGGCRTMAMASLNQTAATFAVYPNPSNADITLSLYDATDYIRIIDMQGKLVYETKGIDAGDFKLDISNYTKGIYFIMAKIGNTLEKQKLVVE